MGHSEGIKGDVLAHLCGVVSRNTGYAIDELDPEFELEDDLGINPIKQAEIFAEFSAHYGLDQDENLKGGGPMSIEALAQRFASRIQESGIEIQPLSAVEAATADVPQVPVASERESVISWLQTDMSAPFKIKNLPYTIAFIGCCWLLSVLGEWLLGVLREFLDSVPGLG